MTLGYVVGTRLKRSVKVAKLKQLLLFQLIRLTIELNTKSRLKASDFSPYISYSKGRALLLRSALRNRLQGIVHALSRDHSLLCSTRGVS